MKDIRPALRTFLLDDAAVSALVGGERIYVVRLPQNKVEPSLVFFMVTEFADYRMNGDSGLIHARMQFDAWAQNADASSELARAVYDRLSGAVDLMSGIDVCGIFAQTGREDYDNEAKMFRTSRDFMVWYRLYDDGGDTFFTTEDGNVFYVAS